MSWTIFGADGFIGSYLVNHLKSKNYEVNSISREAIDFGSKNLGHIVYCAGLTSDFRTRPFDTVEAHVSLPAKILEAANFESFLYLSSTRVYQRCSSTEETTEIVLRPEDYSDLYNISKIMGEAICFSSGRKEVRIARLSNILGYFAKNRNFIDCLFDEALSSGRIHLQTAPESAKDYLFIDEVVPILEKISLSGRYQVYNVASGNNVTNAHIAGIIKKKTDCNVTWADNAPPWIIPEISVSRIKEEFAFVPSSFDFNLDRLIKITSELHKKSGDQVSTRA